MLLNLLGLYYFPIASLPPLIYVSGISFINADNDTVDFSRSTNWFERLWINGPGAENRMCLMSVFIKPTKESRTRNKLSVL